MICLGLVWLYRSPIPVERRGVLQMISTSFAAPIGRAGGGGRHPVLSPHVPQWRHQNRFSSANVVLCSRPAVRQKVVYLPHGKSLKKGLLWTLLSKGWLVYVDSIFLKFMNKKEVAPLPHIHSYVSTPNIPPIPWANAQTEPNNDSFLL